MRDDPGGDRTHDLAHGPRRKVRGPQGNRGAQVAPTTLRRAEFGPSAAANDPTTTPRLTRRVMALLVSDLVARVTARLAREAA